MTNKNSKSMPASPRASLEGSSATEHLWRQGWMSPTQSSTHAASSAAAYGANGIKSIRDESHFLPLPATSPAQTRKEQRSFFMPNRTPAGGPGRGTVIRVILMCFGWYAFSAAANTISKSVLNLYPIPLTVALSQIGSITLYQFLIIRVFKLHPYQPISMSESTRLVLPLAFGKFLSTATSAIAVSRIPISYVHTIKGMSPLFAVALSRVMLKEKQSMAVYLSLMPIIFGVSMASLTELRFDLLGLVMALTACLLFTLQNIYSKKLMREQLVDHMNLLFQTARLSTLLMFPVWLYLEGSFWNTMLFSADLSLRLNSTQLMDIVLRLLGDGFFNHCQNVTAMTFLFMVSPVSYSVGNTTKRIVVIVAGILVFRNPVSLANACGMTLALLGVALYNYVKIKERSSPPSASLQVERITTT